MRSVADGQKLIFNKAQKCYFMAIDVDYIGEASKQLGLTNPQKEEIFEHIYTVCGIDGLDWIWKHGDEMISCAPIDSNFEKMKKQFCEGMMELTGLPITCTIGLVEIDSDDFCWVDEQDFKQKKLQDWYGIGMGLVDLKQSLYRDHIYFDSLYFWPKQKGQKMDPNLYQPDEQKKPQMPPPDFAKFNCKLKGFVKDKIPLGQAFRLYNGAGLLQEQIDQYKDMEGDKNGIYLKGSKSFSFDRNVALPFACDDPWRQKKGVLIEMEFKNKKGYECFQTNTTDCTDGPIPAEKEIFLNDGIQVMVKAITEREENGQKYTLIQLLKE